MKIKKYMRSKTDDGLNDYIESLENYFLELKANNTLRLIFKLDEMNGLIADDIDKIIKGEDWEDAPIDIGEDDENSIILNTGRTTLKILSDSKDSKVFDRVMVLYTKLKDLKSVTEHVSNLLPEVEEIEEEKVDVKITKGKNAFEDVMDQVKGKK